MEVRLSSRRTEITPRLEEYTVEKVKRLDRFVAGLDHSDVHFAEESNPRIADRVMCEVTVEGHGTTCEPSTPHPTDSPRSTARSTSSSGSFGS